MEVLSEHSTWLQCERLLPHALLATQYIETDHTIIEEAGRLRHKTASYLGEHTCYAEAEPLFQLALQTWEQHLGPEHLDMTTSLNNLATLYYRQGKYAEAESLFQRALHIREKHLESEHLDLATSLSNLANLYREQGKYTEAEPLFQRARQRALPKGDEAIPNIV